VNYFVIADRRLCKFLSLHSVAFTAPLSLHRTMKFQTPRDDGDSGDEGEAIPDTRMMAAAASPTRKQVRFGFAPPALVLPHESLRACSSTPPPKREADQFCTWRQRVRWVLSPDAFSLHLWKQHWSSPTFIVMLADLLYPSPAASITVSSLLAVYEFASVAARSCGFSVQMGFFDQHNSQQFLPQSPHANALRFFAADPHGCIPLFVSQQASANPPVVKGDVRVWIPLSRWMSDLNFLPDGTPSPTLPEPSLNTADSTSQSSAWSVSASSHRQRKSSSISAWTFQDEYRAKFWRSDWLLTGPHNQTAVGILDLTERPPPGATAARVYAMQTAAVLKVSADGTVVSKPESVSLHTLGRLLEAHAIPQEQWPPHVPFSAGDLDVVASPRSVARVTFLPPTPPSQSDQTAQTGSCMQAAWGWFLRCIQSCRSQKLCCRSNAVAPDQS
jgi:hypothetical protein